MQERSQRIAGSKKTILIFVIHHIISDGWSLEIIANELFQFYNAWKQHKIT